ncbi:MAG TPA: hypothetical protein VH442_20750, partial [Micromonosporaceae bacterium]
MGIDSGESETPPVDALADLLTARIRAAAVAEAALLDAVVAVADREPAGFDADLVAFTLAWTRTAARTQVEFGRYLQHVIKPVRAALSDGALDVPRARVFHDVLACVDDGIAFAIAAEFADRAAGWTTGQLRDRLRRAVLRADPLGAAERAARTVERRRLVLAAEQHSTASLFASCLPAVRAAAAFERVDAIARSRRADGDGRPIDQLRADTFLDLLEGVSIGAGPVHRRGVVEITVPWSALGDEFGRSHGASDTERMPSSEPAILAGFGPIEAPTARSAIAELGGRRNVSWRFRVDGEEG